MCEHSAEQVLVCWDGVSCCNPLERKGDVGSLLIVLRRDRLHRLVKSGNSDVEEVMVSGLKNMEVLFDTVPQQADGAGTKQRKDQCASVAC